MSKFAWFIVGVLVGAFAGHQFARTEQGQRFIGSLEGRTREFGAAVAEGYHTREAELRSTDIDGPDSDIANTGGIDTDRADSGRE